MNDEPSWHVSEFRFYAELNDFLPPRRRQRSQLYRFRGAPAIQDAIEAQGVPHTEVDVILMNGKPVSFSERLKPGDRVSVYPPFAGLRIAPPLRLREQPPGGATFVVDANLGKLARRLRMMGFDTLYDPRDDDRAIADLAARDRRIVLTRDRRLLFARRIDHGLWVRATAADAQVREVVERLDLLAHIRPLRRCIACNGLLRAVAKADILAELPPKTRLYYEDFRRCGDCGKIYWEGTHVTDMRARHLHPYAKPPGNGGSEIA